MTEAKPLTADQIADRSAWIMSLPEDARTEASPYWLELRAFAAIDERDEQIKRLREALELYDQAVSDLYTRRVLTAYNQAIDKACMSAREALIPAAPAKEG